MFKSVAPPSLTLLKRNFGTRLNEAASVLSSFPKFRRFLIDLQRLRISTKSFIEMSAGQLSIIFRISSGIELLAKW